MTGKGQTPGMTSGEFINNPAHIALAHACHGLMTLCALVLRDYVRSKFRFTASFSTVFANSRDYKTS